MNKIDLSYTAGIIDGEGCITIEKHKNSGNQANVSGYTYVLQVSVLMANKWICYWLQEGFEGNVRRHVYRTQKHCEQWRWRVCSKLAYNFLIKIKPYLKLKQDQAELGLRFQKKKSSRHYGRYNPKTKIETQQEMSNYEEIKRLHHVGLEEYNGN